ncbi:MAG: NUDIX domain-containing protein [Candidatus Paceibacterota bacterium]|jgi:8-oxo-dGTP diphosphatase
MELQVGVKIFLKNKDGKYLTILRSGEKYTNVPVHWEFAGGRINPGSVLLENLKREVMEETGLEITGEPKLLAAQDLIRPHKHIVRLTYSGFADGEVKLSDEHTDYQWLSLEDIKKLEPMDKYFKEVLNNFNLE